MSSENRRVRTVPPSDGDSSSIPVNTPSASSDDQFKAEQSRSGGYENERHTVRDIQEILELERRLLSTERKLAQRVQQWNFQRRIRNPELRLMYRSALNASGPPSNSSGALSFDSRRPVDAVAVKSYFKRKRGNSGQRSNDSREELSPSSNSAPGLPSSQPSQSLDGTQETLRSRSTTPSSESSSNYAWQAPHIEVWRKNEPSFMTFQFMSNYNPIHARPSMSADERYRISMLSSCNVFLKSRLKKSDPHLPPVDTSPKSYAIRALDLHAKARDHWEQERHAEAMQAVSACCETFALLIQHQQPALLSCMAVIVSELHHWVKPEYAQQLLRFTSDLAVIRLSKQHPLTIFLWCMRAMDVDTQRQLTELFLTRGITALQQIDPTGLADLVSNFEFQLKRIYEVQGRFDAALDLMKKRTYHYEIHFGHYAPDTLNTIYQIARSYFLNENFREARFNFQDVLRRVPNLPEDAGNRVWLRLNSNARLAQCHKRLNNLDQARENALECLRGPNDGEEDMAENWRLQFIKEGIIDA